MPRLTDDADFPLDAALTGAEKVVFVEGTDIKKATLDDVGEHVASRLGVFNVLDYGAVGDGVTDDTAAIQAATDAANTAGGGLVLIPAGSYKLTNNVVGADNVHFRGAGIGATTLINGPGGYERILFFNGVSHVTVEGFSFDLAVQNNFATALDVSQANNVIVRSCEFLNTGSTGTEWTLHGVLAQDSSDLIVDGCFFTGLQCKATGGANGPLSRITFTNCHSVNAFNFAFSAVGGSSNRVIEDVTITNCITENAESGGIFVGQDGTTGKTGTVMRRVRVDGNTVIGNTSATVAYIQVDLCDTSESVQVVNNIVEGVTKVSNVNGIAVTANDSVSKVDGLVVSNNAVRTTDMYGISVRNLAGNVTRAVVSNNTCWDTRGIRLRGQITASSNVISGATQMLCEDGDFVLVGNLLVSPTPAFEAGAIEVVAASGQTSYVLAVANVVANSTQRAFKQSGLGTVNGRWFANEGRSAGKPSTHAASLGSAETWGTPFDTSVDSTPRDIEVTTSSKGLILKSPDGTRYRVTVANGGTLSVAAA